jgi:hypothetical protein
VVPTIRHPDELTRSVRLCISCTQTELPAAQQRKLVNHWCEVLPTLDRVRSLRFDSNVTQNLFDAACQMKNLEALWIKWSGIKSLAELRNCQALRRLYIGSSAQIQSIEPLGKMTGLLTLGLQNLKRITDLSPLSSLTELEELSIDGGIWGHQVVDSLAPLAELTSLKWLHLGGVRSLDDSLRPLAALRKLKLVFANLGNFPLEELAWLAVTFSKIYHGVEPFHDYTGENASVLPCKKCGKRSIVLLFGKGRSRNICKTCDAKKLAEHVAFFNDCVAKFSAAKK